MAERYSKLTAKNGRFYLTLKAAKLVEVAST